MSKQAESADAAEQAGGEAQALLSGKAAVRDELWALVRRDRPDLCHMRLTDILCMGLAAITELQAIPPQGPSDADMFWNDADPERGHDSIFEVLDGEFGDGTLNFGDTRVIQQATRLPNITVRIVAAPDDEDNFDFEIVEAARATT